MQLQGQYRSPVIPWMHLHLDRRLKCVSGGSQGLTSDTMHGSSGNPMIMLEPGRLLAERNGPVSDVFHEDGIVVNDRICLYIRQSP